MAQPDRPTLAVTKVSEGVWSTQTAFGENVERKWDTSRLSEAAAKYATVNNVTIGWGDTSTVRFPKHATGEAALCEFSWLCFCFCFCLSGLASHTSCRFWLVADKGDCPLDACHVAVRWDYSKDVYFLDNQCRFSVSTFVRVAAPMALRQWSWVVVGDVLSHNNSPAMARAALQLKPSTRCAAAP